MKEVIAQLYNDFCYNELVISMKLSRGITPEIYTKRRNKLLVDNIRNEFFLNVLSFPRRSTSKYTKEIKVAEGKKFPPC